ncbi:MAG: hypothetical protein WDW38_010081 [Sanguina aurantia]
MMGAGWFAAMVALPDFVSYPTVNSSAFNRGTDAWPTQSPVILLYVVLTIIRPQDCVPGLVGIPLLPVVNGWSGGAVEELAKFGPVAISFFIFAAACTSQRRLIIAMGVFVLCAMVLALHGVEQAKTGIGWTGTPLIEDGRIQYVGIFNDPNDLGLLFVATLPMAVYLRRFGGFLGKLFWLAGALLLLYGVYLTNSRGAMLAVLVVGVAGIAYATAPGPASAAVAGLVCMQALSRRSRSARGPANGWSTARC